MWFKSRVLSLYGVHPLPRSFWIVRPQLCFSSLCCSVKSCHHCSQLTGNTCDSTPQLVPLNFAMSSDMNSSFSTMDVIDEGFRPLTRVSASLWEVIVFMSNLWLLVLCRFLLSLCCFPVLSLVCATCRSMPRLGSKSAPSPCGTTPCTHTCKMQMVCWLLWSCNVVPCF